jgi:hypothetical protein
MKETETSNTYRRYMEAVKAAEFIPVREQNTNLEYLEDIKILGLRLTEYAIDPFEEPARPAARGKLDGWDIGYFTPSGELMIEAKTEESRYVHHWVSGALGSHTQGHLIMVASGKHIAATRIITRVNQWLKDMNAHWFEWDENNYTKSIRDVYKEAHHKFWIRLFDDLRQEPKEISHLIISGSE